MVVGWDAAGSAPEDAGRVGVKFGQQRGWGGSRGHVVHQVPAAATPAPLLAELDADPTGIFWG